MAPLLKLRALSLLQTLPSKPCLLPQAHMFSSQASLPPNFPASYSSSPTSHFLGGRGHSHHEDFGLNRRRFGRQQLMRESGLATVSGDAFPEHVDKGFCNPSTVGDLKNAKVDLQHGGVILIDGLAIVYAAYYKHLKNDSLVNKLFVDTELIVSTAISNLIDILELIPSHVAVVFDYCGRPCFVWSKAYSEEWDAAKGSTFRHTYYPSYNGHCSPILNELKGHLSLTPEERKRYRPLTPKELIQACLVLKGLCQSLSIKVLEIPGVGSQDVVGTMATHFVDLGYKVQVVSPNTDFYQILSSSLQILRISQRDHEMTSFGMNDFVEKFGPLSPFQFVDVVAICGHIGHNIPGVEYFEFANAMELITKFGTIESLLENVDQIEDTELRKALKENADQVVLNKKLVTIICDLPHFILPNNIQELIFKKGEKEKFIDVLKYWIEDKEGGCSDTLAERIFDIWKKL